MEDSKPKISRVGPVGTFLTILFVLILVGLNIWQVLIISDLRVEVERTKLGTFLEAQEMVIDKYWAEQNAEYGCIVGNDIMEMNRVLLKSFEGVTALCPAHL